MFASFMKVLTLYAWSLGVKDAQRPDSLGRSGRLNKFNDELGLRTYNKFLAIAILCAIAVYLIWWS